MNLFLIAKELKCMEVNSTATPPSPVADSCLLKPLNPPSTILPLSPKVNEPFSNNEMANIPNGMYVRVHASLKAFQGKRQLLAFSVRPMTDFNELTYHFLECMYAHMYNTKLRATSVSAEPQMMTSVNGTLFRGLQGLQ